MLRISKGDVEGDGGYWWAWTVATVSNIFSLYYIDQVAKEKRVPSDVGKKDAVQVGGELVGSQKHFSYWV